VDEGKEVGTTAQPAQAQRIAPPLQEEVMRFISNGGVSLLIRGSAGTGKTNILYCLMEMLKGHELILWTNHAPTSAKLELYPFLRDKFIIGREILERAVVLQKIYERIGNLPPDRRAVIVMDDVERLVSRYLSTREYGAEPEVEVESLVQNIESEFVSKQNAALIMTSERTEGGPLEHMAGGCITLSRTHLSGRLIREMEINKLEDTSVARRMCVFTLAGGKFRCIEPPKLRRTMPVPSAMPKIPPAGDIYSSGNASLDGMLGGGYRRGSFNLFEAASEVPEWVCLSVVYPTIYNFISQNCGIILSIAGSQTPASIHRNIAPVAGEDKFASLVRVLTPFTQATRQQYVLSAHSESSKERLNIWKNAVSHLRGATGDRPVLDITSFAALEHTFEKPALLQMIDEGIKRINYEGDIGLGIVRSESEIARSLANLSDAHFRLIEIHGAYGIFGIKPKTEISIMNMKEDDPVFDLLTLS
jgi:hypothetical protein